jgi:uncharacterized repeat protein (TIGR01451 family)
VAGGSTHAPITFAATVNSIAAAGLNNIVNVASVADDGTAGADPTPANNQVTDTDTLDAAPDLHVTKTGNPVQAVRGGDLSYTLTYSNVGNQDATGAFLTEVLPTNTSFNAATSTTGWTETAPGSGVYLFAIGNLPAGAAPGSVSFVATVNDTLLSGTTKITNLAGLDDDHANGTDPVLADNSATVNSPLYQGIYAVSQVRIGRAAPKVLVYDVATNTEMFEFTPYPGSPNANVRLGVGDLNGDGYDDIITARSTGNGAVRVFDGLTGAPIAIGGKTVLNPGPLKTRFGVFVASGDLTGDGHDDIVIGENFGGNKVVVIDGLTGNVANSFRPFASGYTRGIHVAVGDVNGDGRDDIAVARRIGGGAIKVYDGTNLSGLTPSSPTLFSVANGIKTGTAIALGDVNGDGKADLIVGNHPASAAASGRILVYDGAAGTLLRSITPLGGSKFNYVRVAAVDIDLDGVADILAASGSGRGRRIEFYNGQTGALLPSTPAFPGAPSVPSWVAGSTPVPAVFGPIV